MPSDHYVLNDSKRSVRSDTSFGACVFTLLAFLLLLVIVLIILLSTKNNGTSNKKIETNSNISSELVGDEEHRTSTSSPLYEGDKSAREDDGEKRLLKILSSTEPPRTEKTTDEFISPYADEGERKPSTLDSVTSHSSTEATTIGINPVNTSEGVLLLEGRNLTDPTSTERYTTGHVVEEGSSRNLTNRNHTEVVISEESEVKGIPSDSPHLCPAKCAVPAGFPEPSTLPPPIKPASCTTLECKELSARMLYAIGHGANPCKHFYEYACGGMRRNKYVLDQNYAFEAFQRIHDEVKKVKYSDRDSYMKFKTFEESCNNYDTTKDMGAWKNAVLEELSNLGSISKKHETFSPNFTNLFLELLKHDRPFIFEVALDINDKQPNKFAIKVFPAQMVVDQINPEDNEIIKCQAQATAKYKNINQIYEEAQNCLRKGSGKMKIIETAKRALESLNIFNSTDEVELLNETLLDYSNFLDLNIEALGEKAARQLELQSRNPELKNIDELNDLFKELDVNWASIIENLIDRPLKVGELIQLYSDRYFVNINNMFKTRKRELHNALLVAFVAERYRSFVESQQRWLRLVQPLLCTRVAALLLPDVASALYVRSFDKLEIEALENQVLEILSEVVKTYEDEFNRASWLKENAKFKEELREKVKQIKLVNITRDSNIMDSDKFDHVLVEYAVNENEFIKNAITLMKRNRKLLYKRIDMNPEDCIWSHFLKPYDSDGVSIYSLKSIAIPLGAMQKPFFSSQYPTHIKMAGLGFAVAHEVAHHLDTIGIHFSSVSDAKGLSEYLMGLPTFNIFKHDVNIEYLNETDFNKHADLNFTFTDIHGSLKNNELLSDKIGIIIALKTFSRRNKMEEAPLSLPFASFTNYQSFFLYLAQKYCSKLDFSSVIMDFFESPVFPPEVRVEQMMDNTDFYKAFNCSIKSPDLPFPYSVHLEEYPEYT